MINYDPTKVIETGRRVEISSRDPSVQGHVLFAIYGQNDALTVEVGADYPRLHRIFRSVPGLKAYLFAVPADKVNDCVNSSEGKTSMNELETLVRNSPQTLK